MLFPSRINRALIPQLFAQLGAGRADVIVLGYGEHHDKVPPEELEKIRKLAERIVNSFDTKAPIIAVQIVGHADRELRVTGKEARDKSERNHSEGRAAEVQDLLLRFMKKLRPRAQEALNRTLFKSSGVGATQLKVLNPSNERERKLNRRVEIFLGEALVTPFDPLPPITFPAEPPDPNKDPNVVFAGNQFRIKMLDATSFGEVFGFTSITFVIWDLNNNRAAAYEYLARIITFGTPLTFTGEGAFSAPFTTPKFIQVDQFGGTASHGGAGAGSVGIMVLTFSQNPFLGPPFSVNVPTGFSKGGGFEAGDGPFKLVAGSVKVFSGP
jgi:hypothetical protein